MGFYYGPSGPPPEDKPGGFREALAMIWVAFSVLALPIGIILGVFAALGLIFWLFTLSAFAGFGAILVIILAVVARGVWEARHPPELK
jgi:hypothetical protein